MKITPTNGVQGLVLLAASLVVGSMFAVWRGYDPTVYSSATFVEVHQGAVRGLNLLLPLLGLAVIAGIAILAFLARRRPATLWSYIVAGLLMVAAGAITRFANQPINDVVMGWSASAPAENWATLRDSWWGWHIARFAAAGAGQVALIAAILGDRT
ncbi:MAG: DUF1772 domain-containing protein [Devosia sp.]|nr:DUF1772 domain-containing protein [Devosia sp.]